MRTTISGLSSYEWARDKVNTGITELNAQLEHLKQVVEAIEAVITAKNDHSSKISIAADSRRSVDEVNQKIQDAPSLNAAIAIRLIESMSKAKEYIDVDPSLDKCPTCQRPMARNELITVVDEQLNQMSV